MCRVIAKLPKRFSRENALIWRTGRCPYTGWVYTNYLGYPGWRWHDNGRWSLRVLPASNCIIAAERALCNVILEYGDIMPWSDLWPKGARVPEKQGRTYR